MKRSIRKTKRVVNIQYPLVSTLYCGELYLWNTQLYRNAIHLKLINDN